MKSRKIAMILGSMGRGGAERVISILSRDYAEKGWDVDIVLLLQYKIGYELHPNVHVINLTCGEDQPRAKRTPAWIKGIRNYVKVNKPDVVLAFAARINLLALIACTGLKQQIFISERNDPKYDGRSKLIDMATRCLYPKATGCVFQTRRSASYFSKLKNKTIIPNPIMITESAAPVKNKQIVTAGRLTAQKNQKLLIEAFAEIASQYPLYTLNIFGGGELLSELQSLAQSKGVAEKVVFHGNVQNLHEQIAAAEIFVLPSDYEGLSNALLEAMMMGLPCIATDCAGSDEYIRDGENGLLVPVGNKDALVQAMKRMLNDAALRVRCAEQAQKDSAAFHKENVLQQWHDLMDN